MFPAESNKLTSITQIVDTVVQADVQQIIRHVLMRNAIIDSAIIIKYSCTYKPDPL